MKKTAGKEGGLCVSASVLRVRTCNSPAAPSRPAAIADGRRCWGILATILLRGTALSSRAMCALKCCGPPFAASKAGSLWVPLLCFLIAASVDTVFATKKLHCPNECSNSLDNTTSVPNVKRGVCVNGVCHCYNGFSGPDCSFGPGPDNKDNFPIKDKAILKILAEEDDNTCDYDSCYSTCAYGGACISKHTCKCFDKWGKGPSDVLLSKPNIVEKNDSSSNSSDPTKTKVMYRKPLVPKERVYLLAVMRSLGVPPRRGDPCDNQWRNPRGFLMVSCNPAGHVVGLDFGRMNLRGTISPSIAGLTHLRDFAINNNLIRGTIPTQIGSLKELEMLLLYKNNLVGKIPDLSKTRLINLVVYGNFLTGGIPKSLAYLDETLLMVDVSFNKLDGTIPSSIWRMKNLETFYINHNHLHGIIPKGVDQWCRIKHMRYEENMFDNKVKNIGNNDVWSDRTHDDRTEEWADEYKNGLVYDKRNRQVVWEQRAKKKAEEKAKVKVMRDKAKAAESKKKGDKLIEDKFKDPEAKEEGSGAESEGGAEGKDGASEAASATGMKIKDQQPSESDISDDR